MSFIREIDKGRGYEAGYFMESEVGMVRKTRQISAAEAVTIGTEKYVLAGTLYSNGDEKGIIYEDVCVTSGDMPGSVVLAGRVYGDLIDSAAKTALASDTNFKLISGYPATERPY